MFYEEYSGSQCFSNSFLSNEYGSSVIKFEIIKSDKLNPQFLVKLRVNVQNLEKQWKDDMLMSPAFSYLASTINLDVVVTHIWDSED